MVLIEIEPCQAETMRVIGMAERYVKRNKIRKGQIWCVYDKDSFPPNDFNGVAQRAEQLIKKIRNCSTMQHGVMNVSNFGSYTILHTTHPIIIGQSIYLSWAISSENWGLASIRKI